MLRAHLPNGARMLTLISRIRTFASLDVGSKGEHWVGWKYGRALDGLVGLDLNLLANPRLGLELFKPIVIQEH